MCGYIVLVVVTHVTPISLFFGRDLCRDIVVDGGGEAYLNSAEEC